MSLEVSRRRVLQLAAGAAGAAAAPVGLGLDRAAAAAVPSSPSSTAGALTAAALTPYLHSTFRVRVEPMRWSAITLDAVSEQSEPGPGGLTWTSAMFSGPASAAFGQGTYTIEHKSLGVLTLFVVPVNRPTSTQRYQVVVSRSAAR